ncbi:sigma-E factor negative regulatory protein [Nitrosovibrio sp. Nv17]|jgi:sigma-E factor negative regulatory protein RseA|uniref:sigma-E factor negative regulatory protein n=1 Tax=Nitrosovibrio sp. Nv17 TaxID=1855339 RepID=UPI000908C7FF|nr:sigma-E factor negative regulatory protein [Nitrosovibrio sp. Nv17]SFW13399.1 anti sigma-E protein, RseA [Nitrosovibrio sp. Nv17]
MKSQISALMDGELKGDDAARIIADLRATDALRDDWALYHLISDVMERPDTGFGHIARRVNTRMDMEPVVLAPHAPARHPARLYAVAASVAAIAVVGWMSLQMVEQSQESQMAGASATTSLAQAGPGSPPAAEAVPVMAASTPAQINDYLLAHGQFSPNTAMHGMTPYLRTSTDSYAISAR